MPRLRALGGEARRARPAAAWCRSGWTGWPGSGRGSGRAPARAAPASAGSGSRDRSATATTSSPSELQDVAVGRIAGLGHDRRDRPASNAARNARMKAPDAPTVIAIRAGSTVDTVVDAVALADRVAQGRQAEGLGIAAAAVGQSGGGRRDRRRAACRRQARRPRGAARRRPVAARALAAAIISMTMNGSTALRRRA